MSAMMTGGGRERTSSYGARQPQGGALSMVTCFAWPEMIYGNDNKHDGTGGAAVEDGGDSS